jgi:drug/metabolite transporter (DMT)-like permease
MMTAAAGLIVLNDAATKYLTEHYPIGQVVCLRQAAAFLFILPYAWATSGLSTLRVVNYRGQALRAALFAGGIIPVVYSLHLVPLTFFTAVLFSSPLWVALLSAPVLGERVRAYQWIAIATGFGGMLLIVQPASADLGWIVLVPVLAALANGLRDTVTRLVSRTDSSLSMLFWSGATVLAGSAATVALGWKALDAHGALWFIATGFCNAAAHFCTIEAFRLGRAAVVAPFRYSALLWAMLIGFLVWGDVPNASMLGGAAIVVAAGIYMVRRSA